jgi:hypothetical protein
MIEKVRVTAMAGRLLKIWGLELVRRLAALARVRKCATAVGNQLAAAR